MNAPNIIRAEKSLQMSDKNSERMKNYNLHRKIERDHRRRRKTKEDTLKRPNIKRHHTNAHKTVC